MYTLITFLHHRRELCISPYLCKKKKGHDNVPLNWPRHYRVIFYQIAFTQKQLKIILNIHEWVSLCFLKASARINCFPHISHLKGFSPCDIWCTVRLLLAAKDFPQSIQRCGLSPVWVRMWSKRQTFCENDFPHLPHTYGFSPVWIILCLLRWVAVKNFFPHWAQAKFLCPLWNISCFLKTLSDENNLSHLLQIKVNLFLCTSCWWIFRWSACVKDSLHPIHWKGLNPSLCLLLCSARLWSDLKCFSQMSHFNLCCALAP